jgi:predicted DCC family thiol-disulfide oxidoreductase YuxK
MTKVRTGKTTPAQLPAPTQRPAADVVIYDGHCRFCRGQVERLARWDRSGRLAFLSLHESEVALRYPNLTHDQLMDQMYVVTRHNRCFGGAAAFRYLTRRLPRLWPLVPLVHIPFSLPLWQWMYRQLAKRRYWFGKTDPCEDGACKLHVR